MVGFKRSTAMKLPRTEDEKSQTPAPQTKEVREGSSAYIPPPYGFPTHAAPQEHGAEDTPTDMGSKDMRAKKWAAQVIEMDQSQPKPQDSSPELPSSVEVREDTPSDMASEQMALLPKKLRQMAQNPEAFGLPSGSKPQSIEEQWAARLLGVGGDDP